MLTHPTAYVFQYISIDLQYILLTFPKILYISVICLVTGVVHIFRYCCSRSTVHVAPALCQMMPHVLAKGYIWIENQPKNIFWDVENDGVSLFVVCKDEF